MRHRATALVAALASVALVPPVATARPTAIGVGEREWRVSLYRSHVPVGLVRFNVRNLGEDDHDLAVRNRLGDVRARTPEIDPGTTARLTVRLRRPGRFVVFCSLTGHEELGMRAVLRVKRRRAR